MQVFISPDDDRRAGAVCALDTGQLRKPVAASTVSGDASNGESSGGADPPPAGLQGVLVRPRTGSACGALPSGRWWSTALAVDNNEGIGGSYGRRQEWRSLR